MRRALLYNPRLLCERLAAESVKHRRLAKLKGTVARNLSPGHIDSLELLELAKSLGIATVYDIGAHVGTWTLLAKAIIPPASVYAFEPLSKHYDAFVASTKDIPDIHLYRVALGATKGPALFRVTDLSDASSILPLAGSASRHFGIHEVERVPVEMVTLDDHCKEHSLPLPDLMKLDVQGYELEVLRGGQTCLKSAKAIIMEVSFVRFYENQCLFDDVLHFMSDIGFCLHALGINTTLGKPLSQTDVLFLPNSIPNSRGPAQ